MDYMGIPTKINTFQSTPSARRATLRQAVAVQHYYISIHALREEGDRRHRQIRVHRTYFNPRPPRGGRQHPRIPPDDGNSNFNPRPPRGGRLWLLYHRLHSMHISIHALREEGDYQGHSHHRMGMAISIHALREEGDCGKLRRGQRTTNFNPRPPRGGRQFNKFLTRFSTEFQSTPSARRATLHKPATPETPCNFNPRPPRGGRLFFKK